MDSHSFPPTRGRGLQSAPVGAVFEPLEARLLLDAAPVFATPLADAYVVRPGQGGLTIGVDGYDADGDALTIHAASDDANLTVTSPTNNPCARLHFVKLKKCT